MSDTDAQLIAPQEVVFIDANVPDLQALLDGLAPGVEAFVLDPTSDGVQQIADILAQNDLAGLSAISIVGHGAPGEILLGSSALDESDLSSHTAALAQIGASLVAGGSLQLFACNVASGATGQQFIADLSQFTGGADVAAATHDVGSADMGGSWNLDASTGAGHGSVTPVAQGTATGAAPAPATVPFTADTLANFQGELVAPPTVELWIPTDSDTNSIISAQDTGNGTASNQTTLYKNAGIFGSNGLVNNVQPQQVVLDTIDNLYFVLVDTGKETEIFSGKISDALAGTVALTTVYDDNTHNSGGAAADNIVEMQVDPVNHLIYFVDVKGFSTGTNDISQFNKISYNASTGAPVGSVTTLASIDPENDQNFAQNGGITGFALDLAKGEAVFAANIGGFISVTIIPATPYLFSVTGLTASSTSVTMTKLPVNIPVADGFFTQDGGLGINDNSGSPILYFALTDGTVTNNGTQSTSSTGSGVYSYNLTNNSGGTFSPLFQQAGNSFLQIQSLTVDGATGKYYGTVPNFIGSPDNGVWVGNLSGGTPTKFLSISDNDEGAGQLALDNAPTLTGVNGTTTEAVQGGSALTLLTGAPAIGDTDSNGLTAGAAIQITNAQSGDNLFVNGQQSGTLDSGKITVAWNSTNHTLTLSGAETFSEYETLLDQVSFQDTGIDNSSGSHPTRSISWSVSDGLISSAAATTTLTIDRAPAPTTHNVIVQEGGSIATVSLSDTDLDNDTITVAQVQGSPANVGQSVTGVYGTLTINNNDTYSYIANNNTAIDGHVAGSHPIDSFAYVVTDGVNGSTVTSNETLNITVNRRPATVNDAATVLAGGTVSKSTGATGVLGNDSDPDGDTLSVSAVNSSGANVGTQIATTYGHITLNSTGTYTYLADNSTAIAGVTGSHAVDTINYTASDGKGGTANGQLTVTIERAPTLNNVPTSIAYTEGGTGTQLTPFFPNASALTISDPDGVLLTGGTVTLSNFFAGDTLTADTTGLAITASYSNGVLTLSGSDTAADYQHVLESITYSSTSANPTDYGSDNSRTLSLSVTDSDGLSGTGSTTINVTAVDNAPVNTLPGTAPSGNEEQTIAITGLSVGDVDADPAGQNLTVTLSVAHGKLTLATNVQNGLTSGQISGNGGNSVVITATQNAINATLASATGLSYLGGTDFNGSDTLTIATDDNSHTGTGGPLTTTNTLGITVNNVNDAPVVVNGTSVALVAVNEGATPSGTIVSDLLGGHFDDSADNQSAFGGSSANNFAGIAVTADAATSTQGVWQYSTDGSSWTTFPTVSAASALLIAATDQIRFLPSSTSGFHGAPGGLTVHLVDDSAGAITTGGTKNLATTGDPTPYSTGTITIGETVNAVNHAPALSGFGNAVSFTEGVGLSVLGTAVVLDASAGVDDVDLDFNGNYAGATLTVARHNGASSQDVFAATGTLTLSSGQVKISGTTVGSFTNSGGTLAITFSGTVTKAQVQSVLQQITYANNSDAPPASAQIDFTFSDGNSGTQGPGGPLTATASTTVNIAATNDAPVLTPASPAAVTYVDGQATPVALLSTGAVTDPDNPANFLGGSLMVAITAGAQSGDEIVLDNASFTVNSGTLKDGSTTIGTIVGLGTSSAAVTLGSGTSQTEVNRLLDAFGFQTTSTDTADARTVKFTFNDGGNVGGGNGGVGTLSANVSQTVHVNTPSDGQLWYGAQGTDGLTSSGSSDNQVGHIDANGSNRDVADVDTQDNDGGFQAIGLDTADGIYFAMDGAGLLRSGHITNDTETGEASQFSQTITNQTGAEIETIFSTTKSIPSRSTRSTTSSICSCSARPTTTPPSSRSATTRPPASCRRRTIRRTEL